MATLQIQDLRKNFKNGSSALQGISFEVADQEAMFLLGPSGAGKTTTLRLVAGLEDPSSGRVVIGGRDVTDWTPRERNLAMVYDKHSLFPHMTVFENLAYPLRVRKLAEVAMKARIQSVAETLQIESLLARLPSQLSGGQMQRVAIGRALVREADVFLLDEPISHLDAQLRARMRVEFKRLQRDFKATMLYVSHDQLEAMTMADRIVLVNKGKIEQIAPPQEMFDRPATLFAATFIGEPSMNTLPAHIAQQGGAMTLRLGGSPIPMGPDWADLKSSSAYIAGIRPQHLALAAPGSAKVGRVDGTVFAVETLGSRVVYDIDISGIVVRVMTSVDAARGYTRQIGSAISFNVDPDFIYLFDASSGETVRQARFSLKAQ